jgi:hypothetical protein
VSADLDKLFPNRDEAFNEELFSQLVADLEMVVAAYPAIPSDDIAFAAIGVAARELASIADPVVRRRITGDLVTLLGSMTREISELFDRGSNLTLTEVLLGCEDD